MVPTSPVRILHVVGGGMNRGGIESWLMNVLRNIDRKSFHMDFMVKTTDECAYDAEAQVLGARIISCPYPERPWHDNHSFRRVLLEHGPFDVVHSHVGLGSGYNLRLAHSCGVPVRIAHTHGLSAMLAATSLTRKAHQELMRTLVRRHATCGLACSGQAGSALYGSSWMTDDRWQILHCGIDLAPFHNESNKKKVRQELGLPQASLVMGHVGGFRELKNHRFLVQIAQEVAARVPDVRLLLVGDGPLRRSIEQQIEQAGLRENVVYLGSRGDVPRLMMGAMDVFVLPSLSEGLGLVLVEAQAAGLPVVYSDVVPPEAEVVSPLCHQLSLSASPAYWAQEIIRTHQGGRQTSGETALSVVEASAFNIKRSVSVLSAIYRGEETAPLTAKRGQNSGDVVGGHN